MRHEHYDLVVLGSGSTAFAAALKAAEMGKTAVMTEARTVGGTCVNRGCLPSKNLIEAAKLVHEARHPRYPGIEPHDVGFDFGELVRQKDEVISEYRDKKYEGLVGAEEDIDVVRGRVAFADEAAVEVDGRRIEGERFLVALGSTPVAPEIEGLDEVPYMTSDLLTSQEDMELTELPESLVVVGGGYVALELGQMFSRFGSRVTIIERSDRVLKHGYEPEVGLAVQRILREEGVDVRTNANVRRVRAVEEGVSVELEGGDEVRAERLLVATGRRPNTIGVGLEKAGVETNGHGEVVVDEFLRTSAPHVFAAGDVIGNQLESQMATPVGAHDGTIVARNAFVADGEGMQAVDHSVIPRAIFTDPQVGIVGLTEEQGIARGHRCWCRTIPMDLVPRAGAIHDTRGIIKMVADADTGLVLGVSMVGVSAAEVIHEAAMGLRFGATIEDFVDMLHVYPTMAEALKIAAISRRKNPAKLSCCAS
ncbi:MAG: mercury(II) reductase [Actinomycetota bacterium]|nr:mercury(II) reductase [Actinomycetota bacterium]MDP9486166.1 mercury(II) reductase [Actinomycetota bacterium]